MSNYSNHNKAFVQCSHGNHTVANSLTVLSDHVYKYLGRICFESQSIIPHILCLPMLLLLWNLRLVVQWRSFGDLCILSSVSTHIQYLRICQPLIISVRWNLGNRGSVAIQCRSIRRKAAKYAGVDGSNSTRCETVSICIWEQKFHTNTIPKPSG